MSEQRAAKERELPTARRLWAGWLLGVAAWGLHLLLSYGLVELYCKNQQMAAPASITFILHGLTLGCFLLALYGAWLARRSDLCLPSAASHNGDDTSLLRSRFMAQSGLMLSLFLALVVLVQGLPNFMYQPCL